MNASFLDNDVMGEDKKKKKEFSEQLSKLMILS